MTTPDEVKRLVERLRDLNEVLYEDAGTYLTADCVLRALDFAARYTEPDAVSVDSSGGISFSWCSWGNELSVQFTCGGQTHWAGVTPDGVRPYGSGEPDPSQWPCLRADAGPDRRDWKEHEMTTPETGHPLLQALIDSISVFDGAACWDFAAMYAVRDALAAQAAQPVALPEPVLQALRFYAHGEHYSIDRDRFDTVSGEPQNWLCSVVDDDSTIIEDGAIARAALRGEPIDWIDGGDDEQPKPVAGEVFSAASPQAAQPSNEPAKSKE